MEIKSKIWLESNGEVILGNGKAKLLMAINELGSIQEAADRFGMSYRHAWGYIQKIENRSGVKFVDSHVGGKGGGSSKLTIQGKKFLGRYLKLSGEIEKLVKEKAKIFLLGICL